MNKTNKIEYLNDKLKKAGIENTSATIEMYQAQEAIKQYDQSLKPLLADCSGKYQQYMEFRDGIAMQMVILKYRLM